MISEETKKAWQKERLEQDKILEKEISEKRAAGKIPSDEEIIKMIPSKAVREYLVKIGHEFSERDRELLRRYLAPKNDDEFETLFEKGRYVSVPHPFRRGDIVAAYGYSGVIRPRTHDGDYSLGIMRSDSDDEEWKKWDNDVKTRLRDITDFSDVATTVEFLQDDGSFSHNHPNPMELEFASDVPDALKEETWRTKYLNAASELMKGNGSIELYEMYKESYTASPEHLIELLEKLCGNLRGYIKDFDDFKKLYFPSDSGEMQKLNSKQKEAAECILNSMNYAVWQIKNNVRDLSIPFAALTDRKKRGIFYEKITDEQKLSVHTTLDFIFIEAKRIIQRIDGFTNMPSAPRKQFYQKSLAVCVSRLKKHAGTALLPM